MKILNLIAALLITFSMSACLSFSGGQEGPKGSTGAQGSTGNTGAKGDTGNVIIVPQR